MNAPAATHRSAAPRDMRPVASGRPVPDRLTRSAAWSQMSLHAYPAIPIPTAASAANASTFGVWTDASAIQPPASTAAVAISRLWARTRRSRSITQQVLVQPLVPRQAAVRGEPKGLGLGRQQEHVRAPQDVGDVVHLAQKADIPP